MHLLHNQLEYILQVIRKSTEINWLKHENPCENREFPAFSKIQAVQNSMDIQRATAVNITTDQTLTLYTNCLGLWAAQMHKNLETCSSPNATKSLSCHCNTKGLQIKTRYYNEESSNTIKITHRTVCWNDLKGMRPVKRLASTIPKMCSPMLLHGIT